MQMLKDIIMQHKNDFKVFVFQACGLLITFDFLIPSLITFSFPLPSVLLIYRLEVIYWEEIWYRHVSVFYTAEPKK